LFTSGVSAQRQLQLYATILDGTGASPASLAPEDVKVQENGADLKILKVEPIEWATKVQLLIDNGSGIGSGNLAQLRNGVRGLIEALPLGIEVTIVTTAPQPRFLQRATTDRQAQLSAIDKLAPDSTVGRFVESRSARRCNVSNATRPTSSASSSRSARRWATTACSIAT
jgi:hypothetical protein